MEFENYAKMINSVQDIETFGQNLPERQKQNRFAIKQNEMVLEETEKSKFVKINDKRYYLSDGIVSLPFSHPLLHRINVFKKEKKNKKLSSICKRKNKLLQMEKFTIEKNDRISLYRSILQQKPIFLQLGSLKRGAENNQDINFVQTTRSFILNGFCCWVKTLDTTQPFLITFWWWDKQPAEKLVLYTKSRLKTKCPVLG